MRDSSETAVDMKSSAATAVAAAAAAETSLQTNCPAAVPAVLHTAVAELADSSLCLDWLSVVVPLTVPAHTHTSPPAITNKVF